MKKSELRSLIHEAIKENNDQIRDAGAHENLYLDIKSKFKQAKGWHLDMKTIKDFADEYYTDSTNYNFGTKEFKDLMGWLKREYFAGGGRAGFRNFFEDEIESLLGKELKRVNKLYGPNENQVNKENDYPTSAPRVYVLMLGNRSRGTMGPYRVYVDKATAEAEAAKQEAEGRDTKAFVQDLAFIK